MNEQHKCKQWEQHGNMPFNIATEIIGKSLWVYDQFTNATPKEYQREHEIAYEIPINNCPFCGAKL